MAAGMIAAMMVSLSTAPSFDDDPQRAGADGMLAPVTVASAASALAAQPAPIMFEPIDRQRTRNTIAGFRVTQREARPAEVPRIVLAETSALDPLPGDRTIDMAVLDYAQRRRPPGAAVDARMSMRLDPGRSSEPDFGMGGIGGALMRVTTALID